MNRWKYALVGLLVGAFAFPLVWNSDPLVIGQTVTVDSTQSPLVVNAVADLAGLTPTDGQSVIIKTGAEKGLWYYDKDSATATGVSVLNGPGSVGRFLVINNDAGSVAAATAITAAEITNDSLLELQAFDGSSAKSLTLAELKKTANVVTVANVASLYALTYAIDNQLYQTLGYATEGIGANRYRYDSGSSATPDYGFIIDGIGGDGSGTGTGRFIAVDRSVARPEHFGAKKHSTFTTTIFAEPEAGTSSIGAGFDSTVAIQRCMDAADANEVNVVFEPGLYFVTDTIDLPTKSAWTSTSSTLHPVLKISGYGAEIRSNFNGPIFSHVAAVGEEDDTMTYWGLNIEGFHFWGPYDFEDAPLKTSVVGVYYERGYTCAITDCRFSRCYQAINQVFVIQGIVDRCRFDECSNGVRCADSGGTVAHVSDCRFYGEDPQGIAYWFYSSSGILDNCVVEGFRVKYPVRVGNDSTGGGLVQVNALWVECPALAFFKVRLAADHTFDVDGFTCVQKGMFLDSTGTIEHTEFSFRRYYAPQVTIGLTAWSATSFAKYDRVNHSGSAWIANVACVAGDVPGVSANWTSEGDYAVCRHTSSLGKSAYSLTDSPSLQPKDWWLNAAAWTDGVLPRNMHVFLPVNRDTNYWGSQQSMGFYHSIFTDGDATPNVEINDFWKTANTAPTTITDFDDRPQSFATGPWRKITIFIDDTNTTFDHGASIKLNGGVDFTPTAKGVITFICHQNVWYEVSRAAY